MMDPKLRAAYLQLVRELNSNLERELKPINALHARLQHLLSKLAKR